MLCAGPNAEPELGLPVIASPGILCHSPVIQAPVQCIFHISCESLPDCSCESGDIKEAGAVRYMTIHACTLPQESY